MIRVSRDKIDPEGELRCFREGVKRAGAIASFVGVVRDDGTTQTLILTHYPGFTERQIKEFVIMAENRWPLEDVLIVHRVGSMAVGEPIVVVATASKHRRAAFQACDFLMDKLKSEAPFWKQEKKDGISIWVEPKSSDRDDLNRWP